MSGFTRVLEPVIIIVPSRYIMINQLTYFAISCNVSTKTPTYKSLSLIRATITDVGVQYDHFTVKH